MWHGCLWWNWIYFNIKIIGFLVSRLITNRMASSQLLKKSLSTIIWSHNQIISERISDSNTWDISLLVGSPFSNSSVSLISHCHIIGYNQFCIFKLWSIPLLQNKVTCLFSLGKMLHVNTPIFLYFKRYLQFCNLVYWSLSF